MLKVIKQLLKNTCLPCDHRWIRKRNSKNHQRNLFSSVYSSFSFYVSRPQNLKICVYFYFFPSWFRLAELIFVLAFVFDDVTDHHCCHCRRWRDVELVEFLSDLDFEYVAVWDLDFWIFFFSRLRPGLAAEVPCPSCREHPKCIGFVISLLSGKGKII